MLVTDKYQFGKLIEDLENRHNQGMIAFTSTSFGLINNWENAPKPITKLIEHEIYGIAFAHIDQNKKEKQERKTKRPSIPLLQMSSKRSFFTLMSKRPKQHSDDLMGKRLKDHLGKD